MILILEGPDGAGKSTAAQLFKAELEKRDGRPYEVIHMSYPKNEEEELSMYKTYKTLFETKEDFILDRAWFSEMIYGPVIRTKSVLSGFDYQALNMLAYTKNTSVVYCMGDRDLFWDRCTTRGEHYVTTKQQYDAIYSLYELMFRSPLKACIGLPIFYYISGGVPNENLLG